MTTKTTTGKHHLQHLVEEFLKANPDPKKTKVGDLFKLGHLDPGLFSGTVNRAYRDSVSLKAPLTFGEGWEEFWLNLLLRAGLVSAHRIHDTRHVWVEDSRYPGERVARKKSVLLLDSGEQAWSRSVLCGEYALDSGQLAERKAEANHLERYPFLADLKPHFAMLHHTLILTEVLGLAKTKLALLESSLEGVRWLNGHLKGEKP